MVEWLTSNAPVPYETALSQMEARVAAIADGRAGEAVWLLEHPALYTAGTSARAEDLREPDRFPVHKVHRGGQYTYHGPGQRVVYVMLDLSQRGRDVRAFVDSLEAWVKAALAEFNVTAELR
ncbi:MAG: lipoate-protein ligase B, partial [Pseudomonadota bacterium]